MEADRPEVVARRWRRWAAVSIAAVAIVGTVAFRAATAGPHMPAEARAEADAVCAANPPGRAQVDTDGELADFLTTESARHDRIHRALVALDAPGIDLRQELAPYRDGIATEGRMAAAARRGDKATLERLQLRLHQDTEAADEAMERWGFDRCRLVRAR